MVGAFAGLRPLLDTGDEVVLFEPMYDSYQACIALAGAIAAGLPALGLTARPTDLGTLQAVAAVRIRQEALQPRGTPSAPDSMSSPLPCKQRNSGPCPAEII